MARREGIRVQGVTDPKSSKPHWKGGLAPDFVVDLPDLKDAA